jgi:ABC-type nitrate/sulfonate/bicarbonate transport system substrate-binding protein
MKLRLRIAVISLAVLSMSFMTASSVVALDKVKFPYSPISYHSLPFLVAYEAKLFEKHGLEVDPVFAGASSLIVQSMLAGEADLAGMAGPAVISNVLKGGDVIQVAAPREIIQRSLVRSAFDYPNCSAERQARRCHPLRIGFAFHR